MVTISNFASKSYLTIEFYSAVFLLFCFFFQMIILTDKINIAILFIHFKLGELVKFHYSKNQELRHSRKYKNRLSEQLNYLVKKC